MRSAAYSVERATPLLLEQAIDESRPPETLLPLQRVARAWRLELIEDLGGRERVGAAARAVIDAATSTWILLNAIDTALFKFVEEGKLIDEKRRQAAPLLSDRHQTARTLLRLLSGLGLRKVPPPVIDLDSYVRERYAAPSREEEPIPRKRLKTAREP
jgi:hypothetical protein